ncbi:MAG: hypothetical protein ACLRJV_18565 [Eubacteriales bacterium]
MTKSKKSIVMHGTLLCPLVLGLRFSACNGTTYRTSTVVAIRQSADMIHLRRQFRLLPLDGPFPDGGRLPGLYGPGRVRVEFNK